MPSRPNDPGIPTLTQRAEPSLYPLPADEAPAPLLTELASDPEPAYADDAFPLLTDVADSDDESDTESDAAPIQVASAALPDATVLTARLQAEVEQLMRDALADAIDQIQTRMDAELPGIVARVLRDVRQG